MAIVPPLGGQVKAINKWFWTKKMPPTKRGTKEKRRRKDTPSNIISHKYSS
jgi:hypothetical protein